MPDAVLIAGANGAGKTTFACDLLPVLYPDAQFLNADEIQREGVGGGHPVAAGRELLRRLDEATSCRRSFAIETTLSSVMYVRRIEDWRASGYRVSLHFIEVPDADFAVRRVAARVARGGHGVPEADVRRRYARGLALFREAYLPVVDRWYHWTTGSKGLDLKEYGSK